jgi:20S proteasome alpha/beta subunit
MSIYYSRHGTDETNEDIEQADNDYPEPLTTVIGIKCSDGIVIGTDSQATARTGKTKDLRAEKILEINKFSALAGSGDSNHIHKLESALRLRISGKSFNDYDLVGVLESVLNNLYKRYNVQKSREMGFRETKEIFHPSSIFGTRLKDGTFGLYALRDDTWVSSISNYIALGSGSDLARLVLDMNSRIAGSQNIMLADLPVEMNSFIDRFASRHVSFIACVTINEIKNFDSQSGGDTRIALITKDGLKKLTNEVITGAYEWYIEQISTYFSKALRNKSVKNMLASFYPR